MDLLVIGASVRAAAGSLRRVGLHPVAFDLYGDRDLVAIATSTRIPPAAYPGGIADLVGSLPPTPWIYTGGLENQPTVVAALSRRFRLLGNGPEILRRVKDPFELAAVLARAGGRTPAVERTATHLPTDGTWLRKPFASGGGAGIERYHGQEAADPGRVFYQKWVAGPSFSATFVRDDATTRLAGVTRQYLGQAGNRFAYRGSLGPWPCAVGVAEQIQALGQNLGAAFGLVGLFGVDLIIQGDHVWVIEVNPRYTASVEVLERASGISIMADHLQVCGGPAPGRTITPANPAPPRFVAKAILAARTAGRLTMPIPTVLPAGDFPEVADIPQVGTQFEPGHPILTVFGSGATVPRCQRDLARRLRLWRARIALDQV